MKIRLVKLTIKNFKGIKHLEVNAEKKNVLIEGKNGVGKSTVPDAINWLWYGKNIADSAKFSVNPVWTPDFVDNQRSSGTADKYGFDKNVHVMGDKIHNIETKVSATYDIDGQEVSLSRSIAEKWTKKRGSLEPEFSGYETSYECSDMKCQRSEKGEIREKDFLAYIESIMPEKTARMILNGTYLLSSTVSWQDRRKILASIAGIDADVINRLTVEKTLHKGLANEQKNIAEKKEIEITTLKNAISGSSADKKEELEKLIKLKQTEIDMIDKEIARISNNELTAEKRKEIIEIESELIKAERVNYIPDFDDKINAAKRERNSIVNQIEDLKIEIEQTEKSIEKKEQLNEELKSKNKALLAKSQELAAQLQEIKERAFKGVLICPFTKEQCSQTNALDNAEKLFNKNKAESEESAANDLEVFEKGRKKAVEDRKAFELTIEPLRARIIEKRANIAALEKTLVIANSKLETTIKEKSDYKPEQNPAAAPLKLKIEVLKAEIDSIEKNHAVIIVEYSAKKEAIRKEKAELETQLATIAMESKIKDMIDQAAKDQKEASRLYVEYMKAVENFDKQIVTVANEISSKINGMFSLVEFRMFETLVNGDIKECCIPTIAGVPYEDANTASKINAGIDIANRIGQSFDISAVSFVDNAESIEKILPSVHQSIVCKFSDKDLSINIF